MREGPRAPYLGGDRCQACLDNEAPERENKRLALYERDVVLREIAGEREALNREDWLAHTADWRDINTRLLRAADRQAVALEEIARQLGRLAERS